MDIKPQFFSRYKTDMSIENLRAKVARRKSISQKENRHKEFRRSRGLSLVDVNVSVVKEHDLTVLEEVNETVLAKLSSNKTDVSVKSRDNISTSRRAMLKRFKEEKELRKSKEQREKANKGVFKCGVYKPENTYVPILTTRPAAKVKPKEKPAPPPVTRVTRSTAKVEAPVPNTRSRPAQVASLNKVVDRPVPKGRGQPSVLKKNEKENKVTAAPSARTTRATAAATITNRLPTSKAAVKNTSVVAKPQRTKENVEQEMVSTKPEPAVLGQEKTKKAEAEVTIEEAAVKSEIPAEKMTSAQEQRKPSFAPENFVFQPMDGLSIFKFQPMTPNRANAFLTPAFTWSPVDGKSNFVFTREHETEENKVPQVSPPDLSNVELKMDSHASSEVKDVMVTLPVREASPLACDQNQCTPTDNSAQSDETHHDVPYFRGLLKSEIQRLSLLCVEWDKRIDMDIPEDAKDLIRTTVGQTRLLLTERFKQFEGLVDSCEFKLGEKETTCTDLDGFWDMIYFQIEDVSKKFVNLEKLEENSWQQTTVKAKKVVRKKAVPATTVSKSQGDDGRSAARNRLAAIKAAMRNKVKQDEMVEEAVVSEHPMQVDPVVFDAGFFRIESPAKLPASIRTKSSSQQLGTPKSTQKVLQKLDFSASDRKEEGTDHMCVQKSSPVKSPVRKALFDTEESLQTCQEDPVVTNPENTESENMPQVVALTMQPVPATVGTENVADSTRFMECSSIDITATELEKETEFAVNETVVDDVFMCSPEKVHEITNPSPKDGTTEILLDEGIRTQSPTQTSDVPVCDRMEKGVDHMHVQKSPSPESPVRKAFDTEESLQNYQGDPVVTNPENAESEVVPQLVDLTKYLARTTTFSDGVAYSPSLTEYSWLETGVTELQESTTLDDAGTVVDDVFMCSPEKVQETKIPSPTDGTIKILTDEDLKNSDNPLDFPGSCTSDMVTHTPLRSKSVIAASDLIVFSPMES